MKNKLVTAILLTAMTFGATTGAMSTVYAEAENTTDASSDTTDLQSQYDSLVEKSNSLQQQADYVQQQLPDGYNELNNATELIQHEMRFTPDGSSFNVWGNEFKDVVTAVQAAEDSAQYIASEGKKYLDLQVVYHPYNYEVPIGRFTASVIAGDSVIPASVKMETGTSDGRMAHHKDSTKVSEYENLNYMYATENVPTIFSFDWRNEQYFYLYDVIAEIDQNIIDSQETIYVLIRHNGNDEEELYKYRIQ